MVKNTNGKNSSSIISYKNKKLFFLMGSITILWRFLYNCKKFYGQLSTIITKYLLTPYYNGSYVIRMITNCGVVQWK